MLSELDATQNVGTVNWNMHSGISLATMGVAGLALGLLSAQIAPPSHPVADGDRIVLVARADARLPPIARSLVGARTVGSITDIDAALNSNTSLVVVDRSVVADAASGSLRELYLRGMALMAINASIADLYRLTGQGVELRAVDPPLASDTLVRLTCDDDCARYPFWSLDWTSCAGAASAGAMGPLSPPPQSPQRAFDAQVERQLALGPPCSAARRTALNSEQAQPASD